MITKTLTVWCNICEEREVGPQAWEYATGRTASDARAEVRKRYGWAFKGGKDICLNCLKFLAEQKQREKQIRRCKR